MILANSSLQVFALEQTSRNRLEAPQDGLSGCPAAKRTSQKHMPAPKTLNGREIFCDEFPGGENAGLKAVTLIATLNPVSQVLW